MYLEHALLKLFQEIFDNNKKDENPISLLSQAKITLRKIVDLGYSFEVPHKNDNGHIDKIKCQPLTLIQLYTLKDLALNRYNLSTTDPEFDLKLKQVVWYFLQESCCLKTEMGDNDKTPTYHDSPILINGRSIKRADFAIRFSGGMVIKEEVFSNNNIPAIEEPYKKEIDINTDDIFLPYVLEQILDYYILNFNFFLQPEVIVTKYMSFINDKVLSYFETNATKQGLQTLKEQEVMIAETSNITAN